MKLLHSALALVAGLAVGCRGGEKEETAQQEENYPTVTGKRVYRGSDPGAPAAASPIVPPSQERQQAAVETEQERNRRARSIEGAATGSALDRLGRASEQDQERVATSSTREQQEEEVQPAQPFEDERLGTGGSDPSEDDFDEPTDHARRSHGHAGTKTGADPMDVPIR